jgi:ATP-dependent Clp protease protease subunit
MNRSLMKRPTNRLERLFVDNRATPRAYRIEAAAGADEATIYLYDVIGYDWWTDGGVTAMQFAKDLAAIKASTIHLRINSPGGDVFDGRAMVASLQQHSAKKIGHVDGLAASAASFILMHCDEIEITDGAMIMIHNGQTFAMGDRHDLGNMVALLEKVDASIADDYAKKTKLSTAELANMMDQETWFTAKEAVEIGFADRIATPANASAKTKACAAWNLSAYDRAPAAPDAVVVEPTEPVTPSNNSDADSEHAHRRRRLSVVDKHPA